VEGRPIREEHRTITALFADLAGSTALGERLDEEEVKLVVGEAIGRIVVEVERLGGYVKDLAGDGVLAFFGAPTAYEDDAERAARAALNILQAVAAYGAEVARGWGVDDLGVRVGICTGSVALGPIGVSGARVEYAAFGDTVNTAARLQGATGIGTALVDAHTYRLIGPLFSWGEARELDLKGKAAPVQAFALLAALPARARLRGFGSIQIAAVGRDREIAAMRRALDDVRMGAGGIVLITGGAGVGKSRLLADSREGVATGSDVEPELLWLEGRCVSYGQTLPYSPFRDLLRDWLGLNEGDPELRIRISLRRLVDQLFGGSAKEVHPYLASLLGLAGEGDRGAGESGLSAEELQRRTFTAVGRLLERLAQDRPVVVAIEDLHWADPTSTQLARSLLGVVERTAVLLVMTQRDERDHAAWGLKEAASRDFPHLVREIALEPLPSDAERTLLYGLIGAGTLTGELERRVLDAADGNPLYLEELVRSLVDAGAIVRQEGGDWRLDHDVPIAIPETVEKVILARVDRLPPLCRQALTAASVIGRRFDLELLAALIGPQISFEEAIHELLRLGFVVTDRRWPRPQYRFKHVLIQEALYRTLLSEERTRLHWAAAESLERHTERTQEDVVKLARHWAAAGVPARAIPYYRRGAELALRVFANEEAVEALTHALELLGEMPSSRARLEEELELRTILGVPLVALGGYGSAAVGDDYSRARDLCVRLGRPVSPPIMRGLAISSITRSEFADAKEYGVTLLAAAERDGDPMLEVEAQYVLGVASFWVGEFTEARRHLDDAIARYSPERHEGHIALYSQDPKVVCLSRLAWSLWFLGYPEQAARARDEAVALGDQLGHPYSRCYANAYGAMVSHDLGEEGRDTELVALETLATGERYRFWQMFGAALRGWTRARDGDRDAINAMQMAIGWFRETGQPLLNTKILTMVARAYLLVGDPALGLDTVIDALDETKRVGAWYLESEIQRLRGEILRASGAGAADIEAAFQLSLDVARRQRAKALELRAVVELARWWAADGSASKRVEGRRLLQDVYDWFTEGHATPDLTAAKQLLDRLS
jgi:class 3 adenylate cyclase/tetratricopeptide (TPR) repeat protein